MIVVVDASVAAMWFLPEPASAPAARLLESTCALAAPELMRLEVGSALLKAVRRGTIGAVTAAEALARLVSPPLRFEPIEPLAEPAFELAEAHGGSIYDGAYIVLARALGAAVATNDAGLARTARAVGVEAWHLAEPAPAWLDA